MRNALVLWGFARTKHFERYREENVIGRNVIERFHCTVNSTFAASIRYYFLHLKVQESALTDFKVTNSSCGK